MACVLGEPGDGTERAVPGHGRRPAQTEGAWSEPFLHPPRGRGPLITILAQRASSLAFSSGSEEPHDACCSPSFLFEIGRPSVFLCGPCDLVPTFSRRLLPPPSCLGTPCQLHLPPCHRGFQRQCLQKALEGALPVSCCPRTLESPFSRTLESPHNLCPWRKPPTPPSKQTNNPKLLLARVVPKQLKKSFQM